VYRSDAEPAAPRAAPPTALSPLAPVAERPAPATARAWIETGLLLMTLPMTMTLGLMIAPVVWALGARARH
jgi:hypothetical protein